MLYHLDTLAERNEIPRRRIFSWYFCTFQLSYEKDSLAGFLYYIEDMREPSQIITNRNAKDLGLAN